MINYLDFLKTKFNIEKASGYKTGYNLNKDENTRGIKDYWIDKEKNTWKINGWSNGKEIGILYVNYTLEENKNFDSFLDNFNFN